MAIEATPQDVSAQVAGCFQLSKGSGKAFVTAPMFAAHVDEASFSSNGITCQDQPLDHAEGIAVHQHPIFESARFALVGVADHVTWPRVAGGEFPLQAGGEGRAAAAYQLAGFYLFQHLRRRQGTQRLAQGGQPPLGDVIFQTGGIHHPDIGQSQLDQAADGQRFTRRASVQHCFRIGRIERRVAVQVDQRCRRAVAQPQAAYRLQGVSAVGRGPARLDPQSLAQLAQQRIGAGQGARGILADANDLAAHRLGMQHLVKLGDAIHIGDRHIQGGRHSLERRAGQPTSEDGLAFV